MAEEKAYAEIDWADGEWIIDEESGEPAGVARYFFSSSVCIYRDMQPGEPEMTEAEAIPATVTRRLAAHLETKGAGYAQAFRAAVEGLDPEGEGRHVEQDGVLEQPGQHAGCCVGRRHGQHIDQRQYEGTLGGDFDAMPGNDA